MTGLSLNLVRGFPPLLAGLPLTDYGKSVLTRIEYRRPFRTHHYVLAILSTDYCERGLTYRGYSLPTQFGGPDWGRNTLDVSLPVPADHMGSASCVLLGLQGLAPYGDAVRFP